MSQKWALVVKDITKEEILIRLENWTKKKECWIFQGSKDYKGYGQLCIGGRIGLTERTHRLAAWIFFDFDLTNTELRVLHKINCPNKSCWNPEHLYIGTDSNNLHDRYLAGEIHTQRRKTHCPQGHEYSKENIYWEGNNRHCLICMKDRDAKKGKSGCQII